jgi:uncharacterized protein (DUF58 family)
MRPTRRAVLVAAAGLAVALLPTIEPWLWPAWPLFLGGFALALGVDGLLAPRRRQVTCTVELPGTLAIGETGVALLSVRVPSPRPLAVTVAVDLSEKLVPQPPLRGTIGGTDVTAEAGAAADAGVATFACPLVPTRRGRIAVLRASIRYTGPLGLLASIVRVELGNEAAVVPDLRPVRGTALRFANERELQAGLKIERYRGDGTELHSLREHAQGDDPRVIDWKASAHHKRLVSRELRAERNHQIVLAVDTGHLMCEPLSGIPKVDHAVASALLLTYVSLRAGDRVGFLSFDSKVGIWAAPQGGIRSFAALSHLASRIDYSEAETNFTLGLTALGQRLSRRSLVVVLTDFVDTTTAELMVENLDRLARRHKVVFVTLQDPGLAAIAAARPRDLQTLHRAVVAAGLLRDREVVLTRLRRQGIACVDGAPSAIGPQLLNTYLEIKRRERI